MHLEVACLPRDATRLGERVALVIDVIRATTTLVTMFERGCRTVALANSVESARAALQRPPAGPETRASALLIGEVAGLPPADFAYGNSPVALADADLSGADLIFSTTNGTKALVAAEGAAAIVAACLRNGRAAVALALELAQAAQADLSIICAGRAAGAQQGLDDLICAGYLVEQILAQTGGLIAAWQPDADFAATVPRSEQPADRIALDDSALVALRLYRSVVADPLRPRPDEIERVFFESSAGQGLTRLNLAADVSFCAQIDVSEVVPQIARIVHGATTQARYPLSILAAA
jgi:2-phosphosulfolactate phosphatase